MHINLNKKGDAGDWINFGGFFLILLLIAVFLVFGIFSYFGRGYNFNKAEAEVLFLKAEECFVENDFFEEDFKERFYEACGLSENALEQHLIYVKKNDSDEEFFIGVYDFTLRCKLESELGSELGCISKDITKGNKTFTILVASAQTSTKISRT